MNRIVLIGNGFDLAHRMKTSYKDFILDYLRTSVLKARHIGGYDDLLIRVSAKTSFITPENLDKEVNLWEITDFLSLKENPNPPITNLHTLPKSQNEFSILIKTDLLDIILNYCDTFNWVDVENEYYNLLCGFANKGEISNINKLNQRFQLIQNLLHNYLSKIEAEYLDRNSEYFRKQPLSEQLTQNIFDADSAALSDTRLESILFLNFNYTSTIEDYISELQSHIKNIKTIYIHGKLNDLDNPIIFGYGDEDSKSFETLEKYNECLEFVKTYRYLRTDNYQNLLQFVDSNDYDVLIMGHSCGLSDKTLLSEIFNNNKCKSIRLLTYNKNYKSIFSIENSDYIEKTYQIGRIFKNKAELRRKLLPFEQKDLLQVRGN